MKVRVVCAWLMLMVFPFASTANERFPVEENAENVDSTRSGIAQDDPIVAMIDSLVRLKFISSNKFSPSRTNKYNYPADSIPRPAESVVKARIKKLDSRTPMEFAYNGKVQDYIDLYSIRYRKYSQVIMGLTEIYFPMFEQILDKHGVPHELKYLPIVESALNPKAKSPAGAMGLWQFMLTTGKIFGLEVNSMIDERCDPLKSTEAAARYLKYLHGLYNDWNMALAAYNAGPGTVNNAIRRSGGKTTYWEIYNYLPKETQGYVPAFIAMNYVMNFGPELNMYPVEPRMKYFDYDTVMICQELDLKAVSAMINVSYEELEFLNPSCKTKKVPHFDGKKNYVYLPKDKVGDFLVNEDSIYNFDGRLSPDQFLAQEQVHYVKKGEYLSSIANKYRVSVSDIKSWNNISGNSVRPGQRLVIKTASSTVNDSGNNVASSGVKNNTGSSTSSSPQKIAQTHTVRSGDSLWSISQKYGVGIDQIKRANGMKGDGLHPGQKIKIPARGNG